MSIRTGNLFHAWLLVFLASMLLLVSGCGNGDSGSFQSNPPTGTVSVHLSDPPTCEVPNGPFKNVYVTIVGVEIHKSANGDESGWVDLAPDLDPTQVDLLSLGAQECFLATLASGTQIEAGQYQQIRLILGDNSVANQVPNNPCGSSANCVVLMDDSVEPLLLSSQAKTGIKIPSGQIAGGKFELGDGEVADLNIDFNACASIVTESIGMSGIPRFRLKPVLHAGEVSLTNNTVSGQLVNSADSTPISGVTAIVALEERDSNQIGRVLMETMTDAQGKFSFCPVPEGTFDLVAAALDGSNNSFAPTVVTGVQAGNAVGDVPMVAQPSPDVAQATVDGQVSSENAGAGVQVDVTLSALQDIGGGTSVTVPVVTQGATVHDTTVDDAACPANTFCFDYSLGLPAANPNVGAVGGPFAQDNTNDPAYSVEGAATQVGTDPPTGTCSSPVQTVGPFTVTAGASSPADPLDFTSCSPPI